MNPEIDYLAKVCANIIKAQNLQPADNILVGAQVISLLTNFVSSASHETVSHRVQDSVVIVKPVEDNRPKRVIAKSGTELFCGECAKPVFKIVTDVTDPMSYKDFVAAYVPVGHSSKMGPNTEIAEMMVDCPICNAEKAVPLTASEV